MCRLVMFLLALPLFSQIPSRTPQSFGAAGDGLHDDTAALNQALEWACSGAHDLLIPDGIYKYTAGLTCTIPGEGALGQRGVRLHGEGPNAILLNTGQSNGGLLVTTPGGTAGPTQYTHFFLSDLHFVTKTAGTAPYALKLFNQNGFDLANLVIEGFDKLTDGIQLAGSEMAHASSIEIRRAERAWHFTYARLGITPTNPIGGFAGVSSLQISGGMVHSCTGPRGVGFFIESGDVVSIRGIHLVACAIGYQFIVPSGVYDGWHNIELANDHLENNDISGIQIGNGPAPPATIDTDIRPGLQTVAPSSMNDIHPGTHLLISNRDGANSEVVRITAVTATTFSAAFATAKTGPGIQLTPSFEGSGYGPLVIRQNSFYEGTGGHAIDVAASDIQITGNIPAGNVPGSGDIVIRPAATQVIVADNHLYGGIVCPGPGGCDAIPGLFLQNNLDRVGLANALVLPDFPSIYRNRMKIAPATASGGDFLTLATGSNLPSGLAISAALPYLRFGSTLNSPAFAGDPSGALKACPDFSCATPWWTVQPGAFRINQPLFLAAPLPVNQGGTGARGAAAARANLGAVAPFIAGSSYKGLNAPAPGAFTTVQTDYLNSLLAQLKALAADVATLKKGVAP